MFFDDLQKIPELAQRSGFSIFAIPDLAAEKSYFSPKNTLLVEPENGKITVDKVRDIIDFCKSKQKSDFYVVIKHAETMNEQAQNAFLKLLEEPAANYHFVLFTSSASALLETVLSRGDLFILCIKNTLETPVKGLESTKLYARRIISAKSADLPAIAEELTKKPDFKKDVRGNILKIVETAIEICYKSYFKTGNLVFLKKLEKLIVLQANLKQNGHIKLHLVADLC